MSIDNAANHATYAMRPQPDLDCPDLVALADHLLSLLSELEAIGGKNASAQMQDLIGQLNEKLADRYSANAGVPAQAHEVQCAINQAPAYRPGPGDCDASRKLLTVR